RIRSYQRPEQRIGGKIPDDGVRIGVQIEHRAYSAQQLLSVRAQRISERKLQSRVVCDRPHTEPAAAVAQPYATAVAVVVERFDPGQQPQGEVAMELLPVPRRQV